MTVRAASTPRVFYWIDHTASVDFNSGVQRVTRMLAGQLLDLGVSVVPLVWNARMQSPMLATTADTASIARWNGPSFHNISSDCEVMTYLAEHPPLPGEWLLVPEVTHISRVGEDLTRPLQRFAREHGLRIAFIFYDAILIKWRIYQSRRHAHERYMLALSEADLVVPISKYCSADLSRWWAIRAGDVKARIVATELPAEFPGADRATAVSTPNGRRDTKILAVGSVDRRKNQLVLLEAFAQARNSLPEQRLSLVLVGMVAGDVEPLLKARVVDGVSVMCNVDDRGLVDHYLSCTFTVFPSLEEGFGLPIAESLWFGKPCICAGFGAMQELAAGGGCLTVDTRSVDEIRDAIVKLSSNADLRRRLEQQALARSLKTWREYAGSVLAAMDER